MSRNKRRRKKKQIETVITHQVIWRTMPWAFFAVQLLDSVARQQLEPRSSLDINRGVLLLCPNSISLASFLHFTCSTMGPPNLACGDPRLIYRSVFEKDLPRGSVRCYLCFAREPWRRQVQPSPYPAADVWAWRKTLLTRRYVHFVFTCVLFSSASLTVAIRQGISRMCRFLNFRRCDKANIFNLSGRLFALNYSNITLKHVMVLNAKLRLVCLLLGVRCGDGGRWSRVLNLRAGTSQRLTIPCGRKLSLRTTTLSGWNYSVTRPARWNASRIHCFFPYIRLV